MLLEEMPLSSRDSEQGQVRAERTLGLDHLPQAKSSPPPPPMHDARGLCGLPPRFTVSSRGTWPWSPGKGWRGSRRKRRKCSRPALTRRGPWTELPGGTGPRVLLKLWPIWAELRRSDPRSTGGAW